MSLYLMCVYGDSDHANWFQEAWAKTGKKLDMGKACVRFKKVEDLALDVIGEAIKRVPAKKYIAYLRGGPQDGERASTSAEGGEAGKAESVGSGKSAAQLEVTTVSDRP